MFRKSNVLLPTDFSHYALYAMKYALAIAKKYDGVVQICHVLDSSLFTSGGGHGLWLTKSDSERLMSSMQEHAESRLAHLVQVANDEGVGAEYHIIHGAPCAKIIETAEKTDCDMIVIATHGRTGFDHMVFGSVCEKVVRHSPVPVLCIKHPEHEFVKGREGELLFQIDRVLFPTDFSGYADKALPYAVSLCKEFDAELVLLHVTEVPLILPEFMPDSVTSISEEMTKQARLGLERIKESLGDMRVDCVVTSGVPYREIAQHVLTGHIDAVVVPTHGRTGLSHAFFGSVAEKVVRQCRCPVLTVRPSDEPLNVGPCAEPGE